MGTVESGMGFDSLAPLALSWLVTYLAHSTLILGGVWIAARLADARSLRLKDSLWKLGLAGGVVTASLQVGIGLATAGTETAIEPSLLPVERLEVTNSTGWQPAAPQPEGTSLLPVSLPRPPPGQNPGNPLPSSVDAADALPALADLPAAPSPEPLAARATDPETWIPSLSGLAGPLFSLWVLAAIASLGWLLRARLRLRKHLGVRHPVSDPELLKLLDRLTCALPRRRRIRLTWSASLPAPVCLGRREICLPRRALVAIDTGQQQAMLAHEVAHLVRGDPAWLFFCGVLQSILFFQPLNRLAQRHYKEASEFLCDDWAARRTGLGFDLATCLAEVAGWMQGNRARTGTLPSMAHEGSQLVSRVERLLEGTPDPSRRTTRTPFAVGLLVVMAVALLAPGASPSSFAPQASAPVVVPAPSQSPPSGVRLKIQTSDSDLLVFRDEGGLVTAAVDGRPQGTERVARRGSMLTVSDADGATRFHVGLLSTGGFSFDATSLAITSGFDATSNTYLEPTPDPVLLQCADQGGTVTLRIEARKVSDIQVRGRLSLAERIVREHGRVLVRGPSGATSLDVHLPAEGGSAVDAGRTTTFIGVNFAPVGEALLAQIGLRTGSASLVSAVAPGLAAELSGLKRFDIITHLDGEPGAGLDQLRQLLARKRAQSQLFLRILRGGQAHDIAILLPVAPGGEDRLILEVEERLADYQRWHALHAQAERRQKDDDDLRQVLRRTRELTVAAAVAAEKAIGADLQARLRGFQSALQERASQRLAEASSRLKLRLAGIPDPDDRTRACMADLMDTSRAATRSVDAALSDIYDRHAEDLARELQQIDQRERLLSPRRLSRERARLLKENSRFQKRLATALDACLDQLDRVCDAPGGSEDGDLRTALREQALAFTMIDIYETEER